jgi:hypothetical protein
MDTVGLVVTSSIHSRRPRSVSKSDPEEKAVIEYVWKKYGG